MLFIVRVASSVITCPSAPLMIRDIAPGDKVRFADIGEHDLYGSGVAQGWHGKHVNVRFAKVQYGYSAQSYNTVPREKLLLVEAYCPRSKSGKKDPNKSPNKSPKDPSASGKKGRRGKRKRAPSPPPPAATPPAHDHYDHPDPVPGAVGWNLVPCYVCGEELAWALQAPHVEACLPMWHRVQDLAPPRARRAIAVPRQPLPPPHASARALISYCNEAAFCAKHNVCHCPYCGLRAAPAELLVHLPACRAAVSPPPSDSKRAFAAPAVPDARAYVREGAFVSGAPGRAGGPAARSLGGKPPSGDTDGEHATPTPLPPDAALWLKAASLTGEWAEALRSPPLEGLPAPELTLPTPTPSALHAACCLGQAEAVRQLLRRGILPTVPDVSGNTPLHYCVLNGSPDAVACAQLLVEARAEPHARNGAGLSALDLAARAPTKALAGYLAAQGRRAPQTHRLLDGPSPRADTAPSLPTTPPKNPASPPEGVPGIRVWWEKGRATLNFPGPPARSRSPVPAAVSPPRPAAPPSPAPVVVHENAGAAASTSPAEAVVPAEDRDNAEKAMRKQTSVLLAAAALRRGRRTSKCVRAPTDASKSPEYLDYLEALKALKLAVTRKALQVNHPFVIPRSSRHGLPTPAPPPHVGPGTRTQVLCLCIAEMVAHSG